MYPSSFTSDGFSNLAQDGWNDAVSHVECFPPLATIDENTSHSWFYSGVPIISWQSIF
jgi:hypothetical protein